MTGWDAAEWVDTETLAAAEAVAHRQIGKHGATRRAWIFKTAAFVRSATPPRSAPKTPARNLTSGWQPCRPERPTEPALRSPVVRAGCVDVWLSHGGDTGAARLQTADHRTRMQHKRGMGVVQAAAGHPSPRPRVRGASSLPRKDRTTERRTWRGCHVRVRRVSLIVLLLPGDGRFPDGRVPRWRNGRRATFRA